MPSILHYYRLLAEGAITPQELNEVTKFQKYALYRSDDAKTLSAKVKEARAEKDPKKRKALFKAALPIAERLKKQASEIPDNDFGDWAIDLCIKPLWWLIADLVSNAAGSKEGITGLSRGQAIAHFDRIIKHIKSEI